MSFEGLVRPFQTIQTILPEPARNAAPLPGEGSDAFISWGAGSSFKDLPPNEDITADDQCSSGLGNRQVIYDPFFDQGLTAPAAPEQAGPATSGTRAEVEPVAGSITQSISQYWSENGWTITGSGDFWTADPVTKSVTYYSTELASVQAREDLNVAKQTARGGTDPQTSPQTITLLTEKKKKKKPQDKPPGVYEFDEIDRYEEAYTVYKPGDNSVYVNVTRALSMRFRGPDGSIYKFNYKPPEPPERPNGPNPPKT